MAYHHTASAAMPAQSQPNQNAAQSQRVNQVQFIEERLRNGISPAAAAGITALLAQLETQPTLPSLAVSIVADVGGYKRTMTCRNGVCDGYDLTHLFLDDRSTAVRGHSVQTTVEQEATPRIPLANVPMPQPLNPAHLVIQPQPQIHPQSGTQSMYMPSAQPTTPSSAQAAVLCQCSRSPCAAYCSQRHSTIRIRSRHFQSNVQCQSTISAVFSTTLHAGRRNCTRHVA